LQFPAWIVLVQLHLVNPDSDVEPAQFMNRKQRRQQEKDAKKEKSEPKSKKPKSSNISPAATPPVGATGPKKRVVAENGKILVVDSAGNVYLEQKNEEGETHEFLLDPDELPAPTIRDTALYRIPLWAYGQTAGRFLRKPNAEYEDISDAEMEVEEVAGDNDAEDFEVLEQVKTSAQNGNGKAVRRNKKNIRGR